MEHPKGSSEDYTKNYFSKYADDLNIISRLRNRQISSTIYKQFAVNNYVNESFLSRLDYEGKLKGHTGCVNCLDWSPDGNLLASGSDDTFVLIWDAFVQKVVQKVETSHVDNIFAVKFLPNSNNSIIATGAGDSKVFIHDLNQNHEINGYSCENRVKRISTVANMPYTLWSASEDGYIREFDIRQSPESDSKKLIKVLSKGKWTCKCKTLSINPVNPHLLAVGANDQFVRLYDRRMIHSQQNDRSNCVSYFVPGHLSIENQDLNNLTKQYSCTNLVFSPDGKELLVNMGSEQVYLFDLYSETSSVFKTFPLPILPNEDSTKPERVKMRNYFLSKRRQPKMFTLPDLEHKELPLQAQNLQTEANNYLDEEKYFKSIATYNDAISIAPNSSVLYMGRAEAYLNRGCSGDAYDALQDCYLALLFNPNYAKANYSMIKCLNKMDKKSEALNCLERLKECPNFDSKTLTFLSLEKEIKESLEGIPNQASNSVEVSDMDNDIPEYDYKQRFCGRYNELTDIKEVNFFGPNGKYIVTGCDDGSFYFWEKENEKLVRIMRGDSTLVNCVQPHPYTCLLATSGIDSDIMLWSPQCKDKEKSEYVIQDMYEYVDESYHDYLRNRTNIFVLPQFDEQFIFSNEFDVGRCSTS